LFHRLAGFDLVHLHYPFFGGAEPVIVRKAMTQDQGLVMTYHMDATASGVKGAIFSAHRRILFPWLVNRVDRILVSSLDYAKHCALAQYDVMDRVEEHPFGIDLERFHPGEELQLREELKIARGKKILLFVGGMDDAHAFKGLPTLFESLKQIQSSGWHAVLVGDGNLKETYRAQTQLLGIDSRVTFAGNVSSEDLPRYYRLADVHLFPSTKRAEAFGLVALEASASGVPSIASDMPGVRTIVRDGDTGLLVTPGDVSSLRDAITLLLTQEDLRARLGFSARVRGEQTFAWDPLIDRLERTYESVLGQQSKREYGSPPPHLPS
jgi:glycosyltransferase involved in cell wall biosynthesis